MDPYVYPGTNVLKNLRDLRDLESLAIFEATATARRLELIRLDAKPGKFDIPHLKAIHRYIFQDVYSWAGEFRSVNIARPGQFYFAFVEQIVATLTTEFQKLSAERHLAGLNAEAFASRAAKYMGELNAIHPFRDGNGRTQREYIRQLALHNGYVLHWARVTRDQMGAASKRSFQQGDSSGLAEIIHLSIQTS
jgi:cell filamentation protein